MTHTEAFAEFAARREEARARAVKVTWRRVSADTGGGYSGLGPGGLLVYVDPGDGVCTYGNIVNGGHRICRGTAPTVTAAKLAAAALLVSEESLHSGLARSKPATDAEGKKRPRRSAEDRQKEKEMAKAATADKAAELKELHTALLGQIKEAAKGSKQQPKKAYVRVVMNGKTVAYVVPPGKKGITVSVPRASGAGYEEIKVASPADAERVMGVVKKRVEALAAK